MKSAADEALAKLEAPAVDRDALERVGRRIAASRRVRSAPGPWRYALLGSAAAVVVLAVYVASGVGEHAAAPLRLADASAWRELAAGAGPREVRYEDTSQVVLSAHTQIRAEINDARQLVIAQSPGRVVYEVHPGGRRRWTVRVDDVRVEVIGTVFTVEQQARIVDVTVRRGHVVVTSPRLTPHRRDLYAGDSVRVGEIAAPVAGGQALVADEATQAAGSGVLPDGVPTPPAQLRTAVGSRPHVAASAAWRDLAVNGEWNAAFAAIGDADFVRRVDAAQHVEELLLLADTARLSGHPALSVEPLTRIVGEYASDRRAALAAFTLGRVHQEQLHDAPSAARAFELAIRLGVSGELLEAARARRVDACSAAVELGCAEDAARDYLAHHLDGPNAARARACIPAL